MTQIRRIAVLTTSLGLAAAGTLAVTTTTTAQAVEAASAAPPTVSVHITKKHKLMMPQRMRPGTHKFVISSADEAGFQLAKPAPGYTKREVAFDLNRALVKGKVPALKRFERNIVLAGGAPSAPGENGVMWANLSPGRYWALDTTAPRTRARRILNIQVSGTHVAGKAHGTSMIRAINEADWAPRPKRMDSSGRLTFRNDAEANHFVILARLAKGKTVRDFRRWINSGANSAPPLNERAPGLDTGVVGPGRQMTMKYDLPRGRYVLVCFWPDADMDGMPHAFMGMYRGLRLT
jgi:hypothetical protein